MSVSKKESNEVPLKLENLVFLVEYLSAWGFNYRVISFTNEELFALVTVNLDERRYQIIGFDQEFAIGTNCSSVQREHIALEKILGIFDMTRIDHLNNMLKAATARGSECLAALCRRIG